MTTCRGCRQRQKVGLGPKERRRPLPGKLQTEVDVDVDVDVDGDGDQQTMLARQLSAELIPPRQPKLLAESEDDETIRVAFA